MRQDITGLALIDTGSSTRIIAAVGVRGFATTVQYNLDQNGANGIYAGTMPASGCPTDFCLDRHQRQRLDGTERDQRYARTSTPTTGNQLGRIDIAVAPSNSNYIYAQVQSIAPTPTAAAAARMAASSASIARRTAADLDADYRLARRFAD